MAAQQEKLRLLKIKRIKIASRWKIQLSTIIDIVETENVEKSGQELSVSIFPCDTSRLLVIWYLSRGEKSAMADPSWTRKICKWKFIAVFSLSRTYPNWFNRANQFALSSTTVPSAKTDKSRWLTGDICDSETKGTYVTARRSVSLIVRYFIPKFSADSTRDVRAEGRRSIFHVGKETSRNLNRYCIDGANHNLNP